MDPVLHHAAIGCIGGNDTFTIHSTIGSSVRCCHYVCDKCIIIIIWYFCTFLALMLTSFLGHLDRLLQKSAVDSSGFVESMS